MRHDHITINNGYVIMSHPMIKGYRLSFFKVTRFFCNVVIYYLQGSKET